MITRIIKREHPFVQIDRRAINDDRLSWRAKGILVYLLSKPNDWTIRSEDIIKHGTDGRDGVRAAMGELRDCGYAKLVNTKNGREWHVNETPKAQSNVKPCPEKPSMASEDEPCPEKPHMALANMADSAPSNKDDSESKNNRATPSTVPDAPGKKRTKDDLFPDLLPELFLNDPAFPFSWQGFVEMRSKKFPLTDHAVRLLVKALWDIQVKFGMKGVCKSLDDATMNSWRGVFVPKDMQPLIAGNNNPTVDMEAKFKEFLAGHPKQSYRDTLTTLRSLQAHQGFIRSEFHRWMRSGKYQ